MGVYDCCICETPIYGAKETRHANPKLAHAECIDKQNERARIEAETVAKIVADLRTLAKTSKARRGESVFDELADRYERGNHAKAGK